ncbi:vascular endothelial growth factor C-like [Arapaima gigas]
MWMLSSTVWILCVLNLICGYEPDYYEGEEDSEVPVAGEQQKRLEAMSSIDELLELLYPEYSLVQHCHRRRAQSDSSHSHPDAGGDDEIWGNHREMALYKVDGTFEIIMEEIQRTICRPREVCLEVSKEYPENTSNFYLPRCVSVHRCGGCCNHEALYCTNTSHSFVNKTLVELSPPRMERSVITVNFVNHTACECQPKRPLHSIIRREVASHKSLCSLPEIPCNLGWMWNPASCQCVPEDMSSYPVSGLDSLDAALLSLCGPNKVLDEERCECVCENGLTEASCPLGWRLDEASCKCFCEGQPTSGACPPNQRWDPELCGCVCRADCPQSQPLNPETCLCQCRESHQSCLLQGKKFNPETCSCYRLPCRTPRRKCPTGSYYSHLVCHCVPNYMRSSKWN